MRAEQRGNSAESTPLWAWVVADPGYAPEHVAREAVRRLGPDARDWARRTRDRYPGARPDALARLAAAECTRDARRHTAVTSAAGILGSVAATGVLVQADARLVLTIAAAYGFDPTDTRRAGELLDLLRLPRLTQPAVPAIGNAARLLAGVAVRRLAAWLVPFGAGLAGAVQGGRAAHDAAWRAMAFYRDLAAHSDPG